MKREVLYQEKRLPKRKITREETLCTGEIKSRGKHAKIWICRNGGLIFQEPSFSKNELVEAYSDSKDERYFEQFEQRKNLFVRSLARIEKYKNSPGRLLDVGSGPGLFVWVAKQAGWEASGLDPSRWAVKEAKKRFGVKVRQGAFEDFKARPESFEVITMWNVLEHFIDPVKALLRARQFLKKDGILALTTININSWFAKLLGRYWPWLIRVHLWYFTPETLKRMLEKTGYRVEWLGGQTRWFSLPYLVSRLTSKSFSWLPEVTLPAPTGDIIFVIARKTA